MSKRERKPGDWLQYLAGVAAEVEARVDRVRHLIGSSNWLASGTYHESLVRELLRAHIPRRFSVSTGFVRWNDDHCSRQLDVVVWDTQRTAPLLEDGEFVVLPSDGVVAVFEVKTTLTRGEFRDALALLHDPAWRSYSNLLRGPGAEEKRPIRGVVAFRAGRSCRTARPWLEELGRFYADSCGGNRAVMNMRLGVTEVSSDSSDFGEFSEFFHPRFVNIVDVVAVADDVVMEQAKVRAADGEVDPGFRCSVEKRGRANLALARFVLLVRDLLNRRIESPGHSAWSYRRAAPRTGDAPALGVFGSAPTPASVALTADQLWCAQPPLW
jgi:hypothetical protein